MIKYICDKYLKNYFSKNKSYEILKYNVVIYKIMTFAVYRAVIKQIALYFQFKINQAFSFNKLLKRGSNSSGRFFAILTQRLT